MNHAVQVFEIARDAKAHDRPRQLDSFVVTADTLERARRATLARLQADGRSVRSLSFKTGGGLAAVVHAEQPEERASR